MFEILSIQLQIVFFIFLSLFPLNIFSKQNLIVKNYHLTLIDRIILNVLIHVNLIFCLSILRIDFQYIFLLQIIFGIIFLFFFYKNKNFEIRNLYFLIFIFFITSILSIIIASELILGWDADFRWIIKALNFFQGNNVENLKTLTDNEYPFLGSLLWAYFWKFSFLKYEYFGRLFYLYLFIITILSLTDILKTNFKNKIIISIVSILFLFKYSYFNGYQDVLIFSLICYLGKFYYFKFIIFNKTKIVSFEILILTILFNTLFWIKNEGMVYALFFLIIYFLLNKYKLYNLKLMISFVLIFTIKYLIYKNLNLPFLIQGETYNKSFLDFDLNILITRFILVIKFYFIFLFDNIIMIVNLISFILIIKFNYNINFIKFFVLFFILNLSFIFGSHMLMNLQNLDFWIKYSIGRFIFQTSGFYLLAFFILCNIQITRMNK